MKCWMRYVLPWIIALCLFLGSSFSLKVEAGDPDSYAVDDIINSISGDLYDYNVVVRDPWNTIYFVSSSFQVGVSYENESYDYDLIALDKGPFVAYTWSGNVWKKSALSSYVSYPYNFESGALGRIGIVFDSMLSSSYAIYDTNGELFFQGPPLLPPVLRPLDLMAVMEEILMVLPLLILSLTFLIGLRKGLRFILSLLHQA